MSRIYSGELPDELPTISGFAGVNAAVNPYLPALNSAITFQESTDIDEEVYGHEGQYSLQYATRSALSFVLGIPLWPFDVAQTLLQVQYLPSRINEQFAREDSAGDDHNDSSGEGKETGDLGADFDTEEFRRTPKSVDLALSHDSRLNLDDEGYLLYSQGDKSTRPSYMLPILRGGVWRTMRTVSSHPNGGYLALLKGYFAIRTCMFVKDVVQPMAEVGVCDLLKLDSILPSVDHDNPLPIATVYSLVRLAVGVWLSPFEIACTRLIVQPLSEHRKYHGFLHAMRSLFSDPLSNPYTSRQLLVPSLCYHGISSLFFVFTPVIIDRVLGISDVYNPLTYTMVDFLLSVTRSLILLPIDTVRKRLQCQPSPGGRPWLTTVDCCPIPYTGIRDCAARIIIEEGDARLQYRSKKNQQRRPISQIQKRILRLSGLYQGLTQEMGVTVGLFLLRVLTFALEDGGEEVF